MAGQTRGLKQNGRKRAAITYIHIHLLPQRLIEGYLDAAGHRNDTDGAIFRPVKNNRTKDCEEALNPDAMYLNVVRYYAMKSGVAAETRVSPDVGWPTAATNALENHADLAET